MYHIRVYVLNETSLEWFEVIRVDVRLNWAQPSWSNTQIEYWLPQPVWCLNRTWILCLGINNWIYSNTKPRAALNHVINLRFVARLNYYRRKKNWSDPEVKWWCSYHLSYFHLQNYKKRCILLKHFRGTLWIKLLHASQAMSPFIFCGSYMYIYNFFDNSIISFSMACFFETE